jgi:hypothetical protein
LAGNAQDGIGVYGTSATGTGIVGGSDASGIGMFGRSVSGIGAFGSSDHFLGVLGTSDSVENPALAGSSLGLNTGVVGFSGPAIEGQRVVPPTPARTGVYGLAVAGPNSRGVTGETRAGRGVNGIATSGVGLYGAAASGYALHTDGRIRLERSSGKVFLKAGTRSVAVAPGVDLTNRSMVLATLQGRVDGSTTVQRVVINSATDTFTIFLTENALRTVVVAWLVLS